MENLPFWFAGHRSHTLMYFLDFEIATCVIASVSSDPARQSQSDQAGLLTLHEELLRLGRGRPHLVHDDVVSSDVDESAVVVHEEKAVAHVLVHAKEVAAGGVSERVLLTETKL